MKLNINGYAQHGKDTVGEMFAEITNVEPYNVSHDIAKAIVDERPFGNFVDWKEAYEKRGSYRTQWFHFIRKKREENPLWLIDSTIERSNMYIGHRSWKEFQVSRPLVDATIWVDASRRGLPKESAESCELTPEHHDFVIENVDMWKTREQVAAVCTLINNRKRAIHAYDQT